jgi:serine/threonine protein phosphatase PrpC
MLAIGMATRSEQGRRDYNEDDLRHGRAGWTWYAVLADGAGGHQRGAEAAERTVTYIEAALREAHERYEPDTLGAAVRGAHADLQDNQGGGSGLRRMHATVVTLWLDARAGLALWAHVGDSRLYRLRHGVVDQVTTDDSVVQRMVEAGLITSEQAREHPHKNQLVAALGIEDDVDPHTLSEPAAIEDGDAYLLCTDGWWESLENQTLAHTLAHSSSPHDWLDQMQAHIEARAKSKQDNFSAIAVWVGDPAQTTVFMADDDDTITRKAGN